MKLPTVTSFFFYVILFSLLFSCENEIKKAQKKMSSAQEKVSPALKKLDSIVSVKNKSKKYDSALFFGHKEYKLAKIESNNRYIKKSLARIETAQKGKENYDSAIFYADKLYNLAESQKDTFYMVKAANKKALSLKELANFTLSYKNFEIAKNLSQKIKDSLRVANALLEISTLEKKTGSFGLSITSAIEGLKYVENSGKIKITSMLYYNIAVAAKEQGDLLTAEKKISQALDLARDSISIKIIGYNRVIGFHDTKANILKEKGSYNEAIKVYETLLSEDLGKLSETIKARISGNLAHTLFLSKGFNKRSDSLLKQSLSFYENDKEISSDKQISGLISINMKLSEMYLKRSKLEALSYLDKVIEQAGKLDNNKSLHEAYQQLIKINGSNKNITKYLALNIKVEREKDSLGSQFVTTKFDFEKSENKRIKAENKAVIAENKAVIAENKTVLAESKLARGRVQTLALLLILIILIVLTFFIYQRIKRRHKIEKLKTVHVTEARISSKVHDELANDLYELMSQLETSSPEKEMVLDKLDTIYNQARDISKQIQSVDTDEKFADELSNLFRSYQSEKVNVLLKRYDIEIWKGISSHIKITMYRVLQELLTNMKKHSNAALVVVSIEKNNKQLFIQYIDNGKGFTEEISKNGLQNAENRIRAIKGKLTFDTELHKGCKFSINIPV